MSELGVFLLERFLKAKKKGSGKRRTYKVGEISETTGKRKVGPGKWATVKDEDKGGDKPKDPYGGKSKEQYLREGSRKAHADSKAKEGYEAGSQAGKAVVDAAKEAREGGMPDKTAEKLVAFSQSKYDAAINKELERYGGSRENPRDVADASLAAIEQMAKKHLPEGWRPGDVSRALMKLSQNNLPFQIALASGKISEVKSELSKAMRDHVFDIRSSSASLQKKDVHGMEDKAFNQLSSKEKHDAVDSHSSKVSFRAQGRHAKLHGIADLHDALHGETGAAKEARAEADFHKEQTDQYREHATAQKDTHMAEHQEAEKKAAEDKKTKKEAREEAKAGAPARTQELKDLKAIRVRPKALERNIAAEGDLVTDGTIVINVAGSDKADKYKAGATGKVGQPVLEGYFEQFTKESDKPATMLGHREMTGKSAPSKGKDRMYVQVGDRVVLANPYKIKLIQHLTGFDAVFGGDKDSSPLVFKKGDETVAVLMPIKGPKGGIQRSDDSIEITKDTKKSSNEPEVDDEDDSDFEADPDQETLDFDDEPEPKEKSDLARRVRELEFSNL